MSVKDFDKKIVCGNIADKQKNSTEHVVFQVVDLNTKHNPRHKTNHNIKYYRSYRDGIQKLYSTSPNPKEKGGRPKPLKSTSKKHTKEW